MGKQKRTNNQRRGHYVGENSCVSLPLKEQWGSSGG